MADDQFKNSADDFFIEPPKSLKKAVLRRIRLEQKKKIMRERMLYLGGIFVSSGAVLFAAFFFGKELMASDFWRLGSLMFTDLKTVLGFWQEFVLSLLETFPTEAFICILMPVFFLLILAKKYSECSEQKLTDLKLSFNKLNL